MEESRGIPALSSTVTKMHVHDKSDRLNIFVTTWDGKLQVFQHDKKFNRTRPLMTSDLSHSNTVPVMSLAVSSTGNKVYYSCEDANGKFLIYERDISTAKVGDPTIIGEHSKPINHLILYNDESLYSFSWDNTCKVWDIRESYGSPRLLYKLNSSVIDVKIDQESNTIMGVLSEGENIFTLDAGGGSEGPNFLKRKGKMEKYGVKSFAIQPQSDRNFYLGTLDGRIGRCEHNFSKNEVDLMKSLRKVHYTENPKLAFPVNAMVYNPKQKDLLVSGGADGKVAFIEVQTQTVYKSEFSKDPVPVTHLEFCQNGENLIIAKGYTWRPEASKILDPKESKARLYVYTLSDSDFDLTDE